VIQAVHKHQDLLRATIATAANDHRLGANEAPPAILSIFLGDQLTHIYEQIAEAGKATESKASGFLGLGTPVLPQLPRHAGDRNRTSPFAFTGNKFEFRAVGSSQSISFPLTVLNTITAEAVDDLATKLEAKLGKKRSKKALEAAVQEVIADSIREHQAIIFNGDGYSEAWHREAEERGLLNLKTTPDALATLTDEKNAAVFEQYDVLTAAELESRSEILREQYALTLNIEASTTASMAKTLVLPAAVRYLMELGEAAEAIEDFGLDVSGTKETATVVVEQVNALRKALGRLAEARASAHEADDEDMAMKDEVIPAMQEVRTACDALEKEVPADLWPLPTYRDMLFMK
jgi:glutamine synthetase